MKQLKFYILLIVCLLCFLLEARGQSRWIPQSLSIKIPIRVHNTNFCNIPKQEVNTSDTAKQTLNIGPPYGYLEKYERSGDTTRLVYGESTSNPLRETKISFIIDTVKRKIFEFRIEYASNIYYSQDVYLVYFDSLNYQQESDSMCFSIDSGRIARSVTDSVYYSTSYYHSFTQDIYQSRSSKIIALIEDTSDFFVNIQFSIKHEVQSSVYDKHEIVRELKANYSFLFDRLSIEYPISGYDQLLVIYDVVGKPVKTITLPLNTDSYALPNLQLQSGVYFAKVGGNVIKVVINR